MKSAFISFARLCAIVVASPLILTHFVAALFIGKDQSLEPHSQLLSLIPGTIGSYVRVGFYRFVLERCDATATIGFGVLFSKSKATVGRHSYIGPRSMIGWASIEDDVLIGPNVQIPSGPNIHGIERTDIPIRNQPGDPKCITIGRDSWIGLGAIVLADVAEQCVIGAGSVVTKPTNPRTINAGVPSREIRERDSNP